MNEENQIKKLKAIEDLFAIYFSDEKDYWLMVTRFCKQPLLQAQQDGVGDDEADTIFSEVCFFEHLGKMMY